MPLGNHETRTCVFCNFSKVIEHRAYIIKWAKEKENQEVYSFLEGYIQKIETKDDEYQGVPITKLIVQLTDKDYSTMYILSANYNSAVARDIINSLANIDKYGWVRFTPFVSKDEKTENEYKHCSVRNNDIIVKKKYSNDEIPKVELVKVGKTTVPNTEKRDEFFDNLFKEVVAKVCPKNTTTHQIDISLEADDDEPPF